MEETKVVRKVGRPKKVIENYEEENEKQREYMRNYMKEYMLRKKDDVEFMEKRRLKIRAYQNNRSQNEEEYRNKKLEYSKNYYYRLKEAYNNTQNTPTTGE